VGEDVGERFANLKSFCRGGVRERSFIGTRIEGWGDLGKDIEADKRKRGKKQRTKGVLSCWREGVALKKTC